MIRNYLAIYVTLIAANILTFAAPLPKEIKMLEKAHAELQGEWKCYKMHSRSLPDKHGDSDLLIVANKKFAIVVKERDGTKSAEVVSDYELSIVNNHIVLVRKNIKKTIGPEDHYSPAYFLDIDKDHLTITFYLFKCKPEFADITKLEIDADAEPIVWKYRKVTKARK